MKRTSAHRAQPPPLTSPALLQLAPAPLLPWTRSALPCPALPCLAASIRLRLTKPNRNRPSFPPADVFWRRGGNEKRNGRGASRAKTGQTAGIQFHRWQLSIISHGSFSARLKYDSLRAVGCRAGALWLKALSSPPLPSSPSYPSERPINGVHLYHILENLLAFICEQVNQSRILSYSRSAGKIR